MALPNYLINLDEMVEAIADAFKSPDLLNIGHQKSYGLQLKVQPMIAQQSVSWIAPADMAITGIRFGVNELMNIGYEDTFDLVVGTDVVMKDIRIKEMYEYKRFRQFYQLPQNEKIEFILHNNENLLDYIWFDIDYINKEIKAKSITIICKNINDNSIIQESQSFVNPPVEMDVNAPTIDGYQVIGDSSKKVKVDISSPNMIVVEFTYDVVPPPPPPPDPEIPHDYDWKITMRWQGNCDTDMDLHTYFDNRAGHIYYGNREIGNGDNKAWLDKDYTSHKNYGDREDKPEIITILGQPYKTANIYIVPYRNSSDLSEEVTVEIAKLEKQGLNILKTYVIPANRISQDGSELEVCEINLSTESIIDKI